jgi:hypothetical protein
MKKMLAAVMMLAAGWAGTNATAQEDADKAAKIANGTRIIAEMEQGVQLYEKRVQDLTDELLKMDASIEKKVDTLVSTLSGLKDTEDSKNRIERNKADLIAGLRKSIQFYAQRRRLKVDEASRAGANVSKEDLQKDIAYLEERINKRVDQIMKVTKSFTKHEDYDKYIHYQDNNDYYDGQDHKEKNPKYEQNKRVTQVSDNAKEDLMADMQTSIQKLRQENILAQDKIKMAGSKEEYDRLVADVEQKDKMIESLSAKLTEMATPYDAPATKPVGSQKAAFELEKLIKDSIAGIQQDFRNMLARKGQLDLERSRLHGTRMKLEYNQGVMKRLKGEVAPPAAPAAAAP